MGEDFLLFHLFILLRTTGSDNMLPEALFPDILRVFFDIVWDRAQMVIP